jgi:hypothetical protein
MMNLPVAPMATAGAPVASTIVVVGAPLVFAVALGLGVLAVLLCVDALRAEARRERRTANIAPAVMPYAAAPQR